jgi:hypothetical protein
MGHMTREQILAHLVAMRGFTWPKPPHRQEEEKSYPPALRGLGWEWFVVWMYGYSASEMRLACRYDDSQPSITEGEFYSYVVASVEAAGDPNAHETVRTPEQPAWSGDGLPPVGAVVEFRDHCAGDAVLAHIVAHHSNGKEAIWSESADDGQLFYGSPSEFRPIRTDEEKAAEEALECIGAEDGDRAGVRDVVERMLAAGYRKQGVE